MHNINLNNLIEVDTNIISLNVVLDMHYPPGWSLFFEKRSNSAIYYIYSGRFTVRTEQGLFTINQGNMVCLDSVIWTQLMNESSDIVSMYQISFGLPTNTSFNILHIPLIIPDTPNKKYFNLFHQTYQTYITRGIAFRIRIKSMIGNIISSLISDAAMTLQSSATRAKILTVVEFINRNYQKDLSLEQLCARANYSAPHLRNLFYEEFSISPMIFLQNVRIEKAKELLVVSNLPICVIAEKTGFKNATYFCRMFRKKTGVSPITYRDISQ